jgi:hypothetical protein
MPYTKITDALKGYIEGILTNYKVENITGMDIVQILESKSKPLKSCFISFQSYNPQLDNEDNTIMSRQRNFDVFFSTNVDIVEDIETLLTAIDSDNGIVVSSKNYELIDKGGVYRNISGVNYFEMNLGVLG